MLLSVASNQGCLKSLFGGLKLNPCFKCRSTARSEAFLCMLRVYKFEYISSGSEMARSVFWSILFISKLWDSWLRNLGLMNSPLRPDHTDFHDGLTFLWAPPPWGWWFCWMVMKTGPQFHVDSTSLSFVWSNNVFVSNGQFKTRWCINHVKSNN